MNVGFHKKYKALFQSFIWNSSVLCLLLCSRTLESWGVLKDWKAKTKCGRCNVHLQWDCSLGCSFTREECPQDLINLYLFVLLPRAVEVNAAVKASLQDRPASSLCLHVAVSLHIQGESMASFHSVVRAKSYRKAVRKWQFYLTGAHRYSMSSYDGRVRERGNKFLRRWQFQPKNSGTVNKCVRTEGSVTAAHGGSFVLHSSENFFFFNNSTAQPTNTILLTEIVQRCALFYLQGWVSVGGSGHARSCLHASRVMTLNRLIKNDSLFCDTGGLYLDFNCGVWYGKSVHATLRAPWLEDGSAVHEGGRSVLHHATFHLCWREKKKTSCYFWTMKNLIPSCSSGVLKL